MLAAAVLWLPVLMVVSKKKENRLCQYEEHCVLHLLVWR